LISHTVAVVSAASVAKTTGVCGESVAARSNQSIQVADEYHPS